jgi:hypothetical protein
MSRSSLEEQAANGLRVLPVALGSGSAVAKRRTCLRASMPRVLLLGTHLYLRWNPREGGQHSRLERLGVIYRPNIVAVWADAAAKLPPFLERVASTQRTRLERLKAGYQSEYLEASEPRGRTRQLEVKSYPRRRRELLQRSGPRTHRGGCSRPFRRTWYLSALGYRLAVPFLC